MTSQKESNQKTRREFMRDGAIAAGLATGLSSFSPLSAETRQAVEKTRSYNADMQYRRLGKTDLWVSAVCMGGHWKRVDKMVPGVFKNKDSWLSADLGNDDFMKNRREVIHHCMDVGINYIDACTREEVMAYGPAVKDRRDGIYFGFSWYQEEMRFPDFRTAPALLKSLDKGLKAGQLDYVDLWRIVMLSDSGNHTEGEVEEMMTALTKAKEQGKVRFTGLSSHDRPHVKSMIEKYPEVVQVVVMPYTANSKELPKDSVFDSVKKHDVGFLGIKPFASNSLFKGDSSPDNANREEDDRLARLAVRYILCNPAITAPIPGLINTQQVDNMAKAVRERGELDVAEAKELDDAMKVAWANLPDNYQWLKNCEYV